MAQNQSDMPSKVRQALILLYIMLAIAIPRGIFEVSRISPQAPLGLVLFTMVFTFILIWFFIYMIGKRKNWARITFLVLFIIGIPLAIKPMQQSWAANPVSGMLGITQIVIQIIALLFLFQKESAQWFKQMKGAKP